MSPFPSTTTANSMQTRQTGDMHAFSSHGYYCVVLRHEFISLPPNAVPPALLQNMWLLTSPASSTPSTPSFLFLPFPPTILRFKNVVVYFPSHGFLFMLKAKCGNILAKAAALRINLNLDGAPITSKSHTHPSHSQTSRLLTSSLSLGVPVPRPTQCVCD